MNSVLTDTGQLINDPNKILNQQHSFFKKLYSRDESVHFDYVNTSGIELDPDISDSLEGEFQMHELQTAVKGMKRNKCPGFDGLTAEFYVVFFQSNQI